MYTNDFNTVDLSHCPKIKVEIQRERGLTSSHLMIPLALLTKENAEFARNASTFVRVTERNECRISVSIKLKTAVKAMKRFMGI
ncbi:hypothetical protein CEXT_186681 [Caerostris extrusa]|uniref:Uncharacterized protein n=1 Tax=Caerostris extrusa TaxID=172846 RepID=A0AAV4YB29_CAEEX|nr:hypothetical protein CEXT_186681 [Caerostris extrusa]